MTINFNVEVQVARIFISNTDPSIRDIISNHKKRSDLQNHRKQHEGLSIYIKTKPCCSLITRNQFVTRRRYKIGSNFWQKLSTRGLI